MQDENRFSRFKRGIYLLPNLFTTLGLFAGFYAIVAAMKGQFDAAAIAIFVAMFADSLDGRVARVTNTQSAFGAEYDSLSDMVSFGLAPALVAYSWILFNLGKVGWLAAFIYTACAALRLARFNTQLNVADKRYFQGLATTPSAGFIGSMVWVGKDYGLSGTWGASIVAVLTVIVGILMVSNIRYHSFKQIDLKGKVPFIAILIIVLIFAAISLDPPIVLLIIGTTYALSGPILTLWSIRQKRLSRKHAAR